MAAIRVDVRKVKNVAGTSIPVKDIHGNPVFKESKLFESDYANELQIRTRDGARTVVATFPNGDVSIWVVSRNGNRLIASYNQRAVYADLMGAPDAFIDGIATYTDDDGTVNVMSEDDYYASVAEEHARLAERQAHNAKVRAEQEAQETPSQHA